MEIDVKDMEAISLEDLQPKENNMTVPEGTDVGKLLEEQLREQHAKEAMAFDQDPSNMSREELLQLCQLLIKLLNEPK